jgi:hypothetical protein
MPQQSSGGTAIVIEIDSGQFAGKGRILPACDADHRMAGLGKAM